MIDNPVINPVFNPVYNPVGNRFGGNQLAITTIDILTDGVPANFTYTRDDTPNGVASVRNSSGKWVSVADNTARLDHSDAGVPLGLLCEGSKVNKNTNTNVNPTATTNVTKGGDALSVLSVVDQTAQVAAANLDLLCTNGDVFYLDNTLGVTPATATIGGTVQENAITITGITKANPAVVTYSGFDLVVAGDYVYITGVVGMTEVNNQKFLVGTVNTTANTFQLSGVDSTGYGAYSSGGTAYDLDPHSLSVFAWAAASGAAGQFGLTGHATQAAITGTTPARYLCENVIPAANTDQFVITADAGKGIYFIVNQLEQGKIATSPIKTAGASATRGNDFYRDSSFNARSYYNQSKGGLVFEYSTLYNDGIYDWGTTTSYIGGIGDQTFPQNRFTSYKLQNHGLPANLVIGANTSAAVSATRDNNRKGDVFAAGIAWVNGGAVEAFSGPGIYGNATMTTSAVNIDEFVLGAAPNNSAQLFGHIKKIHVFYGAMPTLAEMVSVAYNSNDWGIACGGQSNMEGYFAAAQTFHNTGERSIMDTLDLYWTGRPAGARNLAVNGSTAGSSFISWQGAGSSIVRWKKIMTAAMAAGIDFKAIWWDQGESDVGYSVAAYKTAYVGIFEDMQAHLGRTPGNYLPVIIVPGGRYRLANNQSSDDNWALLKQAQQEMARDYSWIYLAPEKSVQPLIDGDVVGGVHLTKEGYAAQGIRNARKTAKVLGATVTGGVDGAEISGVTRSGTTVDVNIAHDGGSDFTPTSSIGGFRFYDGSTSTEIPITAAVRLDADTIRLTLNSTPASATQILRYNWDQLYSTLNTALVVDNQSIPVALRGSEWRSADTGASWANIV